MLNDEHRKYLAFQKRTLIFLCPAEKFAFTTYMAAGLADSVDGETVCSRSAV